MSKTIRLASPLQCQSIADGPGLRMVLWCQGCKVGCKGCHNPETHCMNGGKEYYIEDIVMFINANYKHHQGLTLSGGDPFLQPKECKEIVNSIKKLGLDIWAYCGNTFEQLLEDPDKLELLKVCDVLVDGPYMEKKRDVSLAFRGSKNQRIIDVQKSLRQGEVVLYGEYN